ncbi:MAG TPA: DUF2243 domain-containing protein [Mycobacteriales bacterium]|nr:DUF2243 domain-containing protein [Mycobacteriales bacterium]
MLGFGIGGLVDGIVLHQVLQWHNLVSAVEPNDTLEGLQRNVFWDGVFHVVTVALAVVGIALTWLGGLGGGRAQVAPGRLVGLVLVGWGAFHVVDQLVFHLLLGLHDIRDAADDPALYNWGFFAIGLGLAAIGTALFRRGPSQEEQRDRSTQPS